MLSQILSGKTQLSLELATETRCHRDNLEYKHNCSLKTIVTFAYGFALNDNTYNKPKYKKVRAKQLYNKNI
eukprot:snap_masked-scaffold_2-processed-gene-4.0-mRNA-1 protein AED:1.00 eAED:1.00 QI:0/0/0/0/1/1/3/0/70